jgi:hypothetical protein
MDIRGTCRDRRRGAPFDFAMLRTIELTSTESTGRQELPIPIAASAMAKARNPAHWN